MAAWRGSSLQSDSRATVPYRTTGTRRHGGYLKRCASTIMKGRSLRTRVTGISVDSSSLRARIAAWAGEPTDALTLTARVNSYTGHGSYTGVTATPGENGVPLHLAGLDEALAFGAAWERDAWDRANREKLG